MTDRIDLAALEFDQRGHSGDLGLRVIAQGDDWAELAFDYDPRLAMSTDSGILASGPIISLIDSASGAAILATSQRFRPMATLGLRIDYMRAALPGARDYGAGDLLPDRPQRRVRALRSARWEPRRSDRLGHGKLLFHSGLTSTLPPYAKMIGARHDEADGKPILSMNWRPELEGRPGFLHGGVIAGLLELACYDALHREFPQGGPIRIKPTNVAVDYLRGGLMVDTHAEAQIVRIGKRVANASALCWQDDRSKPIATARMHLLLDR